MVESKEVRRLTAKWQAGQGWPKRLEWIEIGGLRGWAGQRFELRYPVMVVVGENGAGKSTILQAIASAYRVPAPGRPRFASDFFPATYWDKIANAQIRYSFRQGLSVTGESVQSVRKPGERWRGNPDRPERYVAYIDLRRVQPVPARVGYTRLVKGHHEEVSATLFDRGRLDRFSQIMGHHYDLAKMALTDADSHRPVPVLEQQGATYSGFHQGAGETTIAELLEVDLPQYSIVLIDEIESSLHPRAQRRLVRDLADRAREREWQVVLTTHSPYVLAELPPDARAQIMQIGAQREIIYGVSPEFAMTRMDDVPQPECDLYVEDIRAQLLLTEVLASHAPKVVQRCQIIPYGAASVGRSLGQMIAANRFPRKSLVFLDGDQPPAPGCINLPGDDAPERVVFEAFRKAEWKGIAERVGRAFADVADNCARSSARNDHHEWVVDAASALVLRGDTLWQAMCAQWAAALLSPEDAEPLVSAVNDLLIGILPTATVVGSPTAEEEDRITPTAPQPPPQGKRKKSEPIAEQSLFTQLDDIPKE